MPSTSSPSNVIPPSSSALPARVRPMIVSPVTLLPEPDSPTMPSVRPSSTENETPSTARTTPSAVRNLTSRSAISRRGLTRAGSRVPPPRVEQRVDDVDDEIGHDDEEGSEQDGPLDHGQVAVDDALVGVAADARDIEEGFSKDRAAEQDADVEAEHRDDRRDRRAYAVPPDDRPLRQTL